MRDQRAVRQARSEEIVELLDRNPGIPDQRAECPGWDVGTSVNRNNHQDRVPGSFHHVVRASHAHHGEPESGKGFDGLLPGNARKARH